MNTEYDLNLKHEHGEYYRVFTVVDNSDAYIIRYLLNIIINDRNETVSGFVTLKDRRKYRVEKNGQIFKTWFEE